MLEKYEKTVLQVGAIIRFIDKEYVKQYFGIITDTDKRLMQIKRTVKLNFESEDGLY